MKVLLAIFACTLLIQVQAKSLKNVKDVKDQAECQPIYNTAVKEINATNRALDVFKDRQITSGQNTLQESFENLQNSLQNIIDSANGADISQCLGQNEDDFNNLIVTAVNSMSGCVNLYYVYTQPLTEALKSTLYQYYVESADDDWVCGDIVLAMYEYRYLVEYIQFVFENCVSDNFYIMKDKAEVILNGIQTCVDEVGN